MESNSEINHEEIPAGRSNLEICPNCLEPNPNDLAVCSYCGRPLRPDFEDNEEIMNESEQTLAAAREAAAREAAKKPEPRKKQENGFRRIMPWLGLYLIYNAIVSCIEIYQQQKVPTEEQPNFGVAYLSATIWFVAGLLMAWPLIKKGWRKLRHLPEEEEEETAAEPQETMADEEEQPEADESGLLTDEEEPAEEPETEPEENGEIAPETEELLPEPDMSDELPEEEAQEDADAEPLE